MSILESFLILFETNSDDVKKGAGEARGVVDAMGLSLKAADGAALSVGKSFMDMAKSAVGFITAAFGTAELFKHILETSEFTAMLNDASDAMDVSVETLSQWGSAVKENGGSVEGFIGTLKNLGSAMTQIDVTGKSRLKPFFDKLHISLLDSKGDTKQALDVLLELSNAFQSMSKQDSAAMGRRMGLDEGTILLLQKGRREVEATLKQYKELGEITKRDTEISDKYHDTVDQMNYAFTVMYAKVGSLVLPVLTKLGELMRDFVGFINNHGRQVEAFFLTVGAALAYLMLPSLIALVAPLARVLVLMTSIGGLRAALGIIAAGAWATVAPFLLWAAALGAIYLVGEDLLAWWNGAPSVIIPAIQRIADALKNILEAALQSIIDLAKNSPVVQLITGVASAAQGPLAYANGVSTFNPGAQARADFLSRAGNVKNNSISIGAVNVQTQATDAKGISNDIHGALTQTLNGYDDGVER